VVADWAMSLVMASATSGCGDGGGTGPIHGDEGRCVGGSEEVNS
jgi:hypothetical protein